MSSPKLQLNWSTENSDSTDISTENSTDWSTPNWNLQVAPLLLARRGLTLIHLSGWNDILLHDLTMTGSEYHGLAHGPFDRTVTNPKGGIRFTFPGVEFLPSNQLRTTHWGLSNFNNQNLGSSAVKINRDFGLIRNSFYCFKIAHYQWGYLHMPWCNFHWLFAPSNS